MVVMRKTIFLSPYGGFGRGLDGGGGGGGGGKSIACCADKSAA